MCHPASSIVDIGHINVNVPNKETALAFYVAALGLTRDPDAKTGPSNLWINVGDSQFHLPSRRPTQRHRGTVGLVLPGVVSSRDAVLQRLRSARDALQGTLFSFDEAEEYVDVQCPWGNRIRLHPPSHQLLGSSTMGMAYIQFDVPAGTLQHIGAFYSTLIGAAVILGSCQPLFPGDRAHGSSVRVLCGEHQALVFRETTLPLPEYDGYHIMLTLSDFPAIYQRLADMQLITRGSVQEEEYRFTDIVNPADGSVLLRIEHECRSMQHAQWVRLLSNTGTALAQL
jgi:catechol 2,3-dioxygenase-like lactoylglutathione lyase family enzyme